MTEVFTRVVLKVATAAPFKALVLRAVVPSLKMTFPVGVPLPGATTLSVAVKVTLEPGNAGFSEEMTTFKVLAAAFFAFKYFIGFWHVSMGRSRLKSKEPG